MSYSPPLPPLPWNEEDRLRAVRFLNSLDILSHEPFERISKLAQRYFDVPIALISLVDKEQVWFKARQGLLLNEVPRVSSFCASAIGQDTALVVSEARQDNRFATNVLVSAEPFIRFYAGYSIRDFNDNVVGTLCIMDKKPRLFTASELADLKYLAGLVEQELKPATSAFLSMPQSPIYFSSPLPSSPETYGENETKDETILPDSSHYFTHSEYEGSTNIDSLPLPSQHTIARYQLLEHTLNATKVGILITDATRLNNPIVYANPGFERMTGYSAQEVMGWNCRFLQGKERNQPSRLEMHQAIREGRSVSVIIRNYRKDATLFYNELQLSPVYNSQSQLTHYIGIQTDVTARVEAEEARQQSDELYHTLIRSFPNGGVILFDHVLRHFLAEGAVFSTYPDDSSDQPHIVVEPALNPSSITSKTPREAFSPEIAEQLEFYYREALSGKATTFELEINQQHYLIHTAPLTNSQHYIFAGIAVLQNITELKVALMERHKAEAYLSATLESITDAFYSLDENWCFTYLNQQAYILLQRSGQDLLGKNIWQEFPEAFNTTFSHMFERAFKEQIPLHFEEYYEPMSSWFEVKAYPIREGMGKGGLSIYFRDINERKKFQVQLENNELRFRTLIEHSAEMITMIGADGKVIYQSPSVVTLMGYTEEELVGKNSFELVHAEDLPGMLSHFRSLQSQPGAIMRTEFRFLHKDGSWRYIETVAQNLLEKPNIKAVVINGRDITTRKKVEIALRQSQEMLNFALDAAQVGLWEYDIASGQVHRSSQVEPLLGFLPGTFKGTFEATVAQAVPEDRPLLLKAVQEAIQNKTPYQLEYRIVRPDNAQIQWLEERGQTSYSYSEDDSAAGSQPVRLSGIVQDITARKNAEAELVASQQQFLHSQKMEAVGRLAGGIAHDFNNLLTAITGYSELILLGLEESDPLCEDINEIKKAAERAASLTRQLLAFSRHQVLQPKVLDLSEVVTEMNKLLRRLIGEDIELVTRLEAEPGWIKADPGQLEQVIVNLAVNARDAMPEGGTLTIQVSNVEPDEEEYARSHPGPSVEAGSYVRLSVSDTGSGMDEETLSKIFEPFFTTKEVGRGTGLGLSTVYGIVEQSGGHLRVASQPGQGTQFEIYLPQVPQGQPQAPAYRSDSAATKLPVGSETILLVEDEEAVRTLSARLLSKAGYKVLQAQHAGEALLKSELYRGKIDLLITDMVMPEMGGQELAGRLLRLQPDLKIIYISGYSEYFKTRQGVPEEAVAFLQKPFTPYILAQKVREVLDL